MIAYLRRNDGYLVVISPIIVIVGATILAVFSDSLFTQFHDSSAIHTIVDIELRSYTKILNGSISVVLSIATMLYLNRLVSEESLIVKLSNLPLLAFSISFFLIPLSFQNVTFWSSVLLFVLFISQCLNCLNGRRLANSIFNAAFILGFLTLFSNGYAIHLVSIVLALVIEGQFNVKRLMLLIIGFITPVYFILAILYIFWPEHLGLISSQLSMNFSTITWTIPVVSLVFLVFLNITFVQLQAKSLNVREKKMLRFEILFAFVSLLSIFLLPVGLFAGLTLVPLVVLNARAMTNAKSIWVTRLLFYSQVIVAAINIVIAM